MSNVDVNLAKVHDQFDHPPHPVKWISNQGQVSYLTMPFGFGLPLSESESPSNSGTACG